MYGPREFVALYLTAAVLSTSAGRSSTTSCRPGSPTMVGASGRDHGAWWPSTRCTTPAARSSCSSSSRSRCGCSWPSTWGRPLRLLARSHRRVDRRRPGVAFASPPRRGGLRLPVQAVRPPRGRGCSTAAAPPPPADGLGRAPRTRAPPPPARRQAPVASAGAPPARPAGPVFPEEQLDARLDEVLAKIASEGRAGLTEEDHRILQEASRRAREPPERPRLMAPIARPRRPPRRPRRDRRLQPRLAAETEGEDPRPRRPVPGRRRRAGRPRPPPLLGRRASTAPLVGQAAVTREWSDWRDGWVWWLQSVYVVAPMPRPAASSAPCMPTSAPRP